jgi:hypothetical protein
MKGGRRTSRSQLVRRDDLLMAASVDPRIHGQGAWCMLHGGRYML